MMEWSDLRVFLAVARERSLGAAARDETLAAPLFAALGAILVPRHSPPWPASFDLRFEGEAQEGTDRDNGTKQPDAREG